MQNQTDLFNQQISILDPEAQIHTTPEIVDAVFEEVPQEDSIFGPIISSYSRAQAIDDGTLVDATIGDFAEVTAQHFKIPVAMSNAVFAIIEQAVNHPKHGNDYKGVWHDVCTMAKWYMKKDSSDPYCFKVKITGAGRKSVFIFKMILGGGDNGEPVLTVTLPNED